MDGPGERTVKMSLLCLLCLSLFPSFSLGRVVGKDEAGFAECNVFFPGRVPPEGFTEPFHVKICQQYNGEPRFATLYSTKDKIPLYSAFKYTGAARSGADESWLLEPQIDDPENDQHEMVIEADVVGSLANLGANQALTSDYVGSGYERGLLNPSLLNREDFQMATYTLTNAVPLRPSLSKIWHSDIRRVVEQALIPHCSKKDQLYLLAGAIPSTVRVKGKVSVPETLWLAACCDAPEGWSLGLVKKVNDESSLADLTVGELEKQLLAGLDLFKGNCGEDNESSEKMEAILQAVSQIREQRVGSTLLDGVYSLWNGTVSYLKAISMVLISIPYDVGRVITNIFLGFLGIIQDVAVITYRILRIPMGFVLHLASFPYYSICAIPSVVKDMATGIGGTFSLAIDATASILHGFYYVVSHIAKRFVPKGSSGD
uniref:Endonuclease domain containing 1 n=1 Tax=Meleagris gallopavo TaxID=9103 RepID=A0A803Y934_MELGA